MFIPKDVYHEMKEFLAAARLDAPVQRATIAALEQKIKDLEAELTRSRNDIKWFMHRLNQVEQERAQLVFASTGTRVSVPQFKPEPEPNPQAILNELAAPFSGVGEDSSDPADQIPEHYENMPRFGK